MMILLIHCVKVGLMILSVDPDDYHAVINVQHEWLKTLQSKQPKTQISIKCN